MISFRYGERVIANYHGIAFKGTIDYDHEDDSKSVSCGSGYFVMPTDGTTFEHSRFESYGNCWVTITSIKKDTTHVIKLNEDLFTI